MRNIATCYSEHAVRVSDSYCSGPLNRSYVSPKSTPSIQKAVSHTYKAKLSSPEKRPLFVTITWCNKLICQGFFLKISEKGMSRNGPQHQLGKPKGHKWLDLENDPTSKIEVYWDLSSAKFEAGPEPLDSYYIVIVLDDKGIVLLLGDMEKDLLVKGLAKRYLDVPRLSVVSQYEKFIGNWNNPICTKVRFCDSGPEHEITIRCCPEDDGPRSPVLSVLVDKKRVVRVKRLQWNFRGNQVIFVDGLLVDVMWDVFGWYSENQNHVNVNSSNNNSNDGLFMFRTRSGLDSRLWLEEEEKKLADKNPDRPEFSLLISASSKKPG